MKYTLDDYLWLVIIILLVLLTLASCKKEPINVSNTIPQQSYPITYKRITNMQVDEALYIRVHSASIFNSPIGSSLGDTTTSYPSFNGFNPGTPNITFNIGSLTFNKDTAYLTYQYFNHATMQTKMVNKAKYLKQ